MGTKRQHNEDTGASSDPNKRAKASHTERETALLHTDDDKALPQLPRILDPSLEKAVFTHPSTKDVAAFAKGQEMNYDRLEVLGDAYLELMATRLIWDQLPGLPAGRISQVREDLIKNETLAGFASQYGFDQRVNAPEDHKTQAKRWIKVRGDVFEAYVAAVILSHPSSDGFEIIEKWLRQLWLPRLAHTPPAQPVLLHKEQLAKKVMSKGTKLRYVDERPPEKLEGGMVRFYIGVYLTGYGWTDQRLGSGSGLNKASAGDQAAERALGNVPLIERVAAAKVAYERQRKAIEPSV